MACIGSVSIFGSCSSLLNDSVDFGQPIPQSGTEGLFPRGCDLLCSVRGIFEVFQATSENYEFLRAQLGPEFDVTSKTRRSS